MAKGWIHARHMKSGGSLNSNPKNNGSHKGPLRRIVRVITCRLNIFTPDWVEFECGHEGSATCGALRGRCVKCKVTRVVEIIG